MTSQQPALFDGTAFATSDQPAASPTLAERFVVPPFSVLDARSGYWQARKRAWLALGIQSELGRGTDIVPNGSRRDASQDGAYQRGYGAASTGLLGLSHQAEGTPAFRDGTPGMAQDGGPMPYYSGGRRPMAAAFRPPLGEYPYPVEALQAQSGTSIFDPVLCELVYRWFCPPAGAVLDPFAGGSVRGIVAGALGRAYTGVDLSAAQIAANERQADAIVTVVRPAWSLGDSRDVSTLAPGAYDLVFSCPPYADLERYSDDPRDLSTMDYPAFLTAYRAIIGASVALLQQHRFAAFVVGDIRDKAGFYRGFVGDTIAAFEAAGARLYNEAILVTAVGSRPIRVGKQFTSGRKLGRTHQQCLVFVKGAPRKAAKACGDVDISTFDPFGMEGVQ